MNLINNKITCLAAIFTMISFRFAEAENFALPDFSMKLSFSLSNNSTNSSETNTTSQREVRGR